MHSVVDRTGQAVLDGQRPGPAGASATFGFLSAPVEEPADAVTDASAGLDNLDDLHSAARLAGDSAFVGNGSSAGGGLLDSVLTLGSGSLDEDMIINGPLAPRPDVGHSPGAFTVQALQASPTWEASEVVTELYAAYYNQLVRLALLLVHDLQTAEEVVQDAFEAMHKAWRRLRDSEKALSYLKQTVVNRSRSVLRHRKVVDMHSPKPAPDEPSAEHAVLALLERSAVVSALRALPERQREAIVLRYYADLSEADIARAMGISRGAVKSHTARAMAALKSTLAQKTP
jgi:RNA polymerase sigma-70 factor (sigma-E family)